MNTNIICVIYQNPVTWDVAQDNQVFTFSRVEVYKH